MIGWDGPAVRIVVSIVGGNAYRVKKKPIIFTFILLESGACAVLCGFLFRIHLVKPTWVKHLAHRHSEVPLRFKVLWQGRVVSRMDSPVGVEVIEPGCVWSATG